MKDRTSKCKHPWFKYFCIGTSTPLSELEKAQLETSLQLTALRKAGRSIKRTTLK